MPKLNYGFKGDTITATQAIAAGAPATGQDYTYALQQGAITPLVAPSAPNSLTGTAGNATASVSWSAPTTAGTTAVTGYLAVCAAPDGSEVAAATTSTSYSFTGLTNGSTYLVSVAAANESAGLGTFSTVSVTPVAPTVPGAPTGLSGTSGNAQVPLTWTAPASDGGASITGYVIEYTPSGGSASTVSTGSTTTSYTKTGLTNGTAYTFRAAAVNSVGQSAWSSSATVTPSANVIQTTSGLYAWYDASAGSGVYDSSSGGSVVTTNGGAVRRLVDLSGSGKHVIDYYSGSYPPTVVTNAKNGLKALYFDTSNGGGSLRTTRNREDSVFYCGSPVTIFAVWKPMQSYAQFVRYMRYSWGDNEPSTAVRCGLDNGSVSMEAWTTKWAGTATGREGTWILQRATMNGTSSQLAVNGTVDPPSSASTSTTPSSMSFSLPAGDWYTDGSFQLGELAFFSGTLSTASVQAIESYLMTKWGLIVPYTPTAVLLTSGTSYVIPAGATSMKAWAVGSGGNSYYTNSQPCGAGGCAFKTWSVSGGQSVSYAAGSYPASGGNGNASTVTFSGTTITGNGGKINGTGGTYSGGDGGANGGSGVDTGGGSTAGSGSSSGAVGGNGVKKSCGRYAATDVSGLLAAVALAGGKATEDCGSVAAFGSGAYNDKYTNKVAGIGGGYVGGWATSHGGGGAVVLYFT